MLFRPALIKHSAAVLLLSAGLWAQGQAAQSVEQVDAPSALLNKPLDFMAMRRASKFNPEKIQIKPDFTSPIPRKSEFTLNLLGPSGGGQPWILGNTFFAGKGSITFKSNALGNLEVSTMRASSAATGQPKIPQNTTRGLGVRREFSWKMPTLKHR